MGYSTVKTVLEAVDARRSFVIHFRSGPATTNNELSSMQHLLTEIIAGTLAGAEVRLLCFVLPVT